MIRAQLLNEIHAALDAGQQFKADDFAIEATPGKDGAGSLSIRYRFDSTYYFRAEIPNTVEERFLLGGHQVNIIGITTPGTLTDTERLAYSSKEKLLAGITQWTNRIRDELLAIPLHRQQAEQQAQLEALLGQIDALPDEYFTRDEAQAVRARLDELEQQLRANIEAAAKTHTDAAAELAALHSDIELLKQSTESLKKAGWAGSLAVRMKRWSGNPENRELLKSGATVARTLLLGDGGKHAP
ncbi:MAG TPA: hypothetical protein VGD56_12825 [Gemmatirosa sp.]